MESPRVNIPAVIRPQLHVFRCLSCEPFAGWLIRFQKFLVLTWGFILLTSGPLPSLAADAPEAQIAAHFRAGQEALRQGEFVRATEEFKKVLALDPTLVEGQVNLGLAYQSLLDYESAIRYLTKALRERPSLAAPNLIVGLDYLRLGAPAKATPFLKQALKLDPSNREAHRALASSYLDRSDFRGAAEEFRQTSVFDPDEAERLFKLGHDYLELSARLAYRGAHLYRESAWGHRFLADLLFQRDRWESAAREYQKALGIDPRQTGLHTSLGQAYLRGSKLEEAEAEFHREIELDPKNELAWLGIAEKQLVTDRTAAAVEAVGKVWESSPEFLAVQREFPTIELSREAAYALVEKLQTSPDGASKDFLLASLYSIAGKGDEAESRWRSFQTELTARQKPQASTAIGTAGPCPAHHYSACLQSLEGRKTPTDAATVNAR